MSLSSAAVLAALTQDPRTFSEIHTALALDATRTARQSLYDALAALVSSGQCLRVPATERGRNGHFVSAWRLPLEFIVPCPDFIALKISLLKNLARDFPTAALDLLEIAEHLEMLEGLSIGGKRSSLTHLDYLAHRQLLTRPTDPCYSPRWLTARADTRARLRNEAALAFECWRDEELRGMDRTRNWLKKLATIDSEKLSEIEE